MAGSDDSQQRWGTSSPSKGSEPVLSGAKLAKRFGSGGAGGAPTDAGQRQDRATASRPPSAPGGRDAASSGAVGAAMDPSHRTWWPALLLVCVLVGAGLAFGVSALVKGDDTSAPNLSSAPATPTRIVREAFLPVAGGPSASGQISLRREGDQLRMDLRVRVPHYGFAVQLVTEGDRRHLHKRHKNIIAAVDATVHATKLIPLKTLTRYATLQVIAVGVPRARHPSGVARALRLSTADLVTRLIP